MSRSALALPDYFRGWPAPSSAETQPSRSITPPRAPIAICVAAAERGDRPGPANARPARQMECAATWTWALLATLDLEVFPQRRFEVIHVVEVLATIVGRLAHFAGADQ